MSSIWRSLYFAMLVVPTLGPVLKPETESNALKLLISVEGQTITEPFPARVTLHLHNSGPAPLWLYRHVRQPGSSNAIVAEEDTRPRTSGGSTLKVRLERVGIQQGASSGPTEVTTPAASRVLGSVGLPHPKLVRLAPGEDYEERAVIRLDPALVGTGDQAKPIWGRYQLSVIYQAQYSNGDEIPRNLGVVVWQGETTSNAIELELEPPAASAQGSVAGSVTNSAGQPVSGERVSLSDREERLLDQTRTNVEGRFSFDHLPLGLYWVTVRREDAEVDTVMFQHVELTTTNPAGALRLQLLPAETYEPKQMLHKPVLVRVTDNEGHPANKVTLEATWSSGTVLDNVKGQTSEDGTAVLDLIPGRNYLTLRQRGCSKQEARLDVAAGDGIDDFKLTLDCKKAGAGIQDSGFGFRT